VIRGDTSFDHVHIDDPVIARADGSVLYNFAVAIDDLDVGITHVIRGEDHLSNTPKQLLVLEALDAPAPTYAHLPLLHGPDGKKLSKRHGAASVQELRDAGYLPEAVRNYIALLGWALDDSTTIMSTEQMTAGFDLTRVSKSPAVFDEQKLRWMNGRYLRELDPADLAARLEQRLGRGGLEQAAELAQEKIQTLDEFWPLAAFLVERQPYDEKAWAKVMKEGARDHLAAARAALAAVEPFDVDGIEAALRQVVEQQRAKPREIFQPVRLAISGSTISPGIFESVAALGREETLARVDDALARS
jgi:glutamyl-tRNA synthetase